MKAHWQKNQRGLLEDIVKEERRDGRRLIHSEASALAFIPVCARYPYETWIAPQRPVPYLYDLTPNERRDLARVLKTVLLKFDALWAKPFPYLMVLYQAPTDGQPHPEAHLHFEIFPPLRTKERLKYLAGTELGGGMFVNDTEPEDKAAELRAVSVSF